MKNTKNITKRNIARVTEHITAKFETKLYRIGNSLYLHVPVTQAKQVFEKIENGLFPKGALKAQVQVAIFPEVM